MPTLWTFHESRQSDNQTVRQGIMNGKERQLEGIRNSRSTWWSMDQTDFNTKFSIPEFNHAFLPAEVTLKKALDLGVLHSCSNTSCYSCSTGIGSSRWPGKKGFEILVTIHSLTRFRKSWKVLLRGWCDMEDKLLVTFKL